jgi:hypothetical protein
MEVFVAAGIGSLVTEDWVAHGSVKLFRVVKERIQAFDGDFADRWTLVEAHRREFSGPVAAISTCSGYLVVAYGHNVRFLLVPTSLALLLSSPCALASTSSALKSFEKASPVI